MIPNIFIENWSNHVKWQTPAQIEQDLIKYCSYNDVKISREEFLKNLELKKNHRDFHIDMSILLPSKLHWNFEEAYQFVVDKVVSRLP